MGKTIEFWYEFELDSDITENYKQFNEFPMNIDLKGKGALVCGSTQGIGRGIAVELASLGANVTLMARNKDALISTVKFLPATELQQHNFLVADFDYPDQVKETINTAVRQFTYQILVNNTGGPPPGLAITADAEQFLKAFSSHLVCNQYLVQACLGGMKEAQYGRIINVISSSVKVPIAGLGVSNTIRGAVANWAKTLAGELAPFGITVNNILPGLIKTGRLDSLIKNKSKNGEVPEETIKNKMIDEIPARRFGEIHEIAAAAAFLASPAASYINGINLPVDGGKIPSL